MTTVDENRLKGNYGANYVASRLSSEECLVRPVVSDTDVGIDLFCESIEGNKPFLHFWIQVKTGNQCQVASNGASASCVFDKQHLAYWDRQPVPVFAALVPTEWPIRRNPAIYIIDVSSYLVDKGFPSSKSITLHSDFVWEPCDQEAIHSFLNTVVPFVTAKIMCKEGVVAQIKTIHPQYTHYSPQLPISRFRDRIVEQIRVTAAMSIISMMSENTLNGNNIKVRRRFAKVLEQFDDDTHWENLMARALSHHADSEFDEAIRCYERARQSILDDQQLCSDSSWQQTCEDIENQITKARNREAI